MTQKLLFVLLEVVSCESTASKENLGLGSLGELCKYSFSLIPGTFRLAAVEKCFDF